MRILKEIVSLVIFIILITNFVIFFSAQTGNASVNTIWVDDDVIYTQYSDGSISKPYKYIQSAIDAAEDGDTIYVLQGDYYQDLLIDKSVTISAVNTTNTFIASKEPNNYLIQITASSVSLEGFTIWDNTTTSHRKAVIYLTSSANNVRIINNNIAKSSNGYGIYIEGSYDSQNAVLNNNSINRTKGIKIINSNSNIIYKNEVGNCSNNPALNIVSSDLIHVENNTFGNSSYGIYITGASNKLTIKNNTISGNSNIGISMGTGSNCNIENNTIQFHDSAGLYLSSSESYVYNNKILFNNIGCTLIASGCFIYSNIFDNSTSYGIYAGTVSKNNYVYNNNFTENPANYFALDLGDNYWDDSLATGNYWDDYLGPDNDNNSRGDIPYTKGGVNDNYPKGKFQKPPVISNPYPSNLATGISKTPTLSIKVEDPEFKRLSIYFYVIIENESRVINDLPVTIESGGRASIPFYSTAQGKNAVYTYQGTGYDYICRWYIVAHDEYSNKSSLDSFGSEYFFTTLETPVDNVIPVADAGGPYVVKLGDNLQLDGSGCYDTNGSIIFYRWSFGDGESFTNVISPTYKYLNEGLYTVNLVVIDNNGASNIDTTTVEVSSDINDPPIVKINGPYQNYVGKSVSFSSEGSYDPDAGDTFTYLWNFGDGTISIESNPFHSYTATGSYTVSLTLIDQDGKSSSTSTIVTIKVDESANTPGFEFVIVLLAIIGVILLKKRKKYK